MSYRIKLLWKVLVNLNSEGVAATRSENNLLFNRKGGKTFLKQIGGDIRTAYAPVVLQPTDVFFQAISGLCEKLDFKGNRFPFSLQLDLDGQQTRLNVALHLYGDVVCITYSMDEVVVPKVTDLLNLQNFGFHPKLCAFASCIQAIIINGDRYAENLSNSHTAIPCIRIVAESNENSLSQSDLVGIVTRHPGASLIVNRVLEKNAPHQIDSTLLLFDKQGVAGYVPFPCSMPSKQAHLQRFINASSMIEYAVVLRKLLKSQKWLQEDVRQAISTPEEAVPNSVSARYMWSLTVKEFSLQTELNKWTLASVKPGTSRILLATVTSIESKALHSAFSKVTGSPAIPVDIKGFKYHNLGILNGVEIFHTISGMGSGGITGAQESVRRSIEAIQPIAVLMVGIAFGINSENHKIGDILVSNQVLMYELQRNNKDFTVTSRGDKVTASHRLLNWVDHAEISWNESIFRIRKGLLLSGEKLVDDVQFRKCLTDLAPEAIGGEMEAAGVYVACQVAKVDWLVIKSICDWADGNKDVDKDANQTLAANSAAEFAAHVLRYI